MTEQPTDHPRTAYGLGLGVLAGLAFGTVYGLSAELFGLTFGLPVVGLVGGWIVGTTVAYGAWGESEHTPHRTVRGAAVALSSAAWGVGLVVAYVVSQALIPQASTGLLERLSVAGFFTYLFGTFDFVLVIHILTLALLAVMAWRAAR